MKREDYTAGWICALPKEQAAALLDDTHEKLPASRNDTTYVLGRIDVHNVVIACLPTMGTTATARCAARLEEGFKSLRFILLVGIGGGVPTFEDVRLGDVVVSMPNKHGRGVVQYDFGTKFQDEHLEIRDTSLRPPSDLLVTAVKTLETKEAQSQDTYLLGQHLVRSANELAKERPGMYRSRRPDRDRLFRADYRHRDDDLTCDQCQCDTSQLVQRSSRKHAECAYVYYGLIASGNEVMRDAKERDRLANEKRILCFEMEAAGLGTELGWLVIKAICDYCDSHKNKDWQEHAAAVAALYAKELLKVIPELKDEHSNKHTSESRLGESVFHQPYMSGGQNYNITGGIKTTGGQAFVGNSFRTNKEMNFNA